MIESFRFLAPSQDLSLAYMGLYDPGLVVLSILTAILASGMALMMAERIQSAHNPLRKGLWLVPGALAMGGGVWAMHFIGMLAFSLPCAIAYDPWITLMSMGPGVVASAVALGLISKPKLSPRTLAVGGVFMGLGIGTMHYSGMAAMRLDAVIYYEPVMFGVSVLFAVALAILALHTKFLLNKKLGNPTLVTLLGGTIMGTAVSGMHYIAMEAAYFIPAQATAATAPGISPFHLAVGIGSATLILLTLALFSAVLGRHLETIDALEHVIAEREEAQGEIIRLSRAVGQSPAAVVITDLEGHIEYVNPKFTLMTGYEVDEVIGKKPNILKSGHMSDKDYAKLWRTIANGQEWRGEMLNKRKDGSLYWDYTSISTIRDSDGTAIHYLAVKEDITSAKAAMEELRHAKEDAEYANHVKSQFLASMSHELRTPLNAIIGFSDMIMSEFLGPIGADKYKEYLGDIHDSGEHLLELITDILDMSKIESGMMELHEDPVELSRVIDACHKLIRHRAQDKSITLTIDLPAQSPVLWGDEVRIKQILINLLTNAVKYTPAGGDVALTLEWREQDGLKMTVSDTGIGMSKDDIPRAMEPFAQVSDIMTSEREGVGLGLFLTRSLVEMHDGTLTLESTPGEGTQAIVHLPPARVCNPGGLA